MKKRLSLVLLACLLVNLGVPMADAAPVDAQLADLATKSTAINATVEQLTHIKQAVESGKKEDILGALAAAAAARAQQNYHLPLAAGGNIQEAVKQAAQQAITQKVQDAITGKAASYRNIINSLGLLQQLQGKLHPAAKSQSDSLTGAPENYKKILDMTATAYAPGKANNGQWGDKTYLGTQIRKGVVAVDPRVIPMGTKLWVEGYGYATADDQGSAIKGNRIDLAFNDFKTASDYGIQNVKVYLLN